MPEQPPSKPEYMPNLNQVMRQSPLFSSRLVSLLVIGFAMIALTWLYFAQVDIVVSAAGKVIPTGKTKIVQAAQAGVVSEIFVRDGMVVKRGTPLIAFDHTVSKAELHQLRRRLDKALLATQRLQLELHQSVPFGQGVSDASLMLLEGLRLKSRQRQFDDRISLLRLERGRAEAAWRSAEQAGVKLKGQIDYYQTLATEKHQHAEQGLIAGAEAQAAQFSLLDSKRQYAIEQQNASEARAIFDVAILKVMAAKTEYKNELLQQLADSEAELEQAQRSFIQADQAMRHQTLLAPVDGVVQQLKVHTVGAVISRAEQLLVLIPNNAELEVEAQILNKDIGFVDRQQSSRVKVDAFEYTRYGYLTGKLDWVASDSVIDEAKGPIYPARISLASLQLPRVVNGRIANVQAGMSVTVDVVIGSRRLIEYFTGPLLRYQDESLTER